jgi:hypothetical protein
MCEECQEQRIDQIVELEFELGQAESKLAWNKEQGITDLADVLWRDTTQDKLNRIRQEYLNHIGKT